MSTNVYYKNQRMLQRLHEGPLGTHIDLFAKRLLKEGHCTQSAWCNLRIVSDFSHWLAQKGFGLHELNEQTVERYLEFHLRNRYPYLSTRPAMKRLLSVLREVNAISPNPSKMLSPLEQIEEDFRRFLIHQRGLALTSVGRYMPFVRLFLQEECSRGHQAFSRLEPRKIMKFVERHVHDNGPRSAQVMCCAIRSFTRYLQQQGYLLVDLSNSVPTVRRWAAASLPSPLSPKQIEKVLDSCDRRSPLGMRNYAILLLLARLGLRAIEIVRLSLDDLDWREGQFTVRGKGGKCNLLPLPSDVGAAIAKYLRCGRFQSDSRRVFLQNPAPHAGFTSSVIISNIATAAFNRAGIDVRRKSGAHLFRHSLATAMLQGGATLTQIGQILRHESMDSTRIYAKVDIAALRALAPSWPEEVCHEHA
ncbi:MAG: tyrosine-type recombinase/integrase [Deltaproteobacteria bacterium]|nr:tyrosine-type recombinase/integrase [Deltaproteobacteria bacterium]